MEIIGSLCAIAGVTSVKQVEQQVRIARELHREVATGKQAKEIYQIGTSYRNADETVEQLGMLPNRAGGHRGTTLRLAAYRVHMEAC